MWQAGRSVGPLERVRAGTLSRVVFVVSQRKGGRCSKDPMEVLAAALSGATINTSDRFQDNKSKNYVVVLSIAVHSNSKLLCDNIILLLSQCHYQYYYYYLPTYILADRQNLQQIVS